MSDRKCSTNINIEGRDNRIVLVENGAEREADESNLPEGLRIQIRGDHNLVRLTLPITAKGTIIDMAGDNFTVEGGPSPLWKRLHVRMRNGSGSRLTIGRDTTFEGTTITVNDSSSCRIGEDCLFSYGTELRSADGNTMYDLALKRALNRPVRPLVIGNHCWIGQGAHIFKNGTIPDNTIVGGMAVVTRRFEKQFTAIAGNPAKVIRHGVGWTRDRSDEESPDLEG